MYTALGCLCFETTDTCNSNHIKITGQRQLCPCYLWNVGNAGLRKDNNPPRSRILHPSLTNPPGLRSSLARCLYSALVVLDMGDTSPCQTDVMNYSRECILMSIRRQNNFSLHFPSPLDVAWSPMKKMEKWLRNNPAEDQSCRVRAQPPVWGRGRKPGKAALWFPWAFYRTKPLG